MFAYYFKLGLRSLRRNPALTALMVITLAVGVAASVSTLTILHMMSNDPIPQKSARLFVPLIDPASLDNYTAGEKPGDIQIAYPDAINILKSGLGVRRTALYGVAGSVEPPRREIPPFTMGGLAPTRDFFAMFEVPFAYGQAWTEADEARGADVVVLSRPIAEKLFGEVNPVGKRLNLMGFPFTVVGVTEKWKMLPRVYLLQGGSPYATGEEFFIPLATAVRHETQHNGGMSCSQNLGPGFAARLASDCTWITAWIETASAGDRSDIQSWLDNYASEQRKLGRLKRNAPNRLFDVPGWMEYTGVVGKDSKLQAWLAFGFLVLCLVNTVGLLLAKFSVRASEIGVRRALGASRTEIFHQFLIETVVVGLVGGLLGLLLAFGALKLIGMSGKAMANLAQMDWQMLGLTFVISVSAAVLAGLLPTWRACQVTPAIQLKSQ
ncbi:ABC transporter permease [Massilia sp. WF1]|uniref:ABC transporter permease n=1 Tax=unclassified Massilia TaxID=2609279 RepID=UPI000691B7DE|nr:MULTISPECIES: ABC transporter permease [unclassified Massilia]ALK95346.1 ABC transporter permease [Massilia sp. WG5]KNZ67324.1 ABC transporter permease [Massilia sp. WF1]